MGGVHNYQGLTATRWFLGVFEAGELSGQSSAESGPRGLSWAVTRGSI